MIIVKTNGIALQKKMWCNWYFVNLLHKNKIRYFTIKKMLLFLLKRKSPKQPVKKNVMWHLGWREVRCMEEMCSTRTPTTPNTEFRVLSPTHLTACLVPSSPPSSILSIELKCGKICIAWRKCGKIFHKMHNIKEKIKQRN